MNDNRIDRLLHLILTDGRRVQVHGQSVAEHCVQTAALAWNASAPLTLVAAALLHDVALLVDEMVGNAGGLDLDPRHEVMAADILEPVFGAPVAEPVRLHGVAGRYLALTEPDYLRGLAPSVREDLLSDVEAAQDGGGAPLSDVEFVRAFVANPWAAAAVRLRRWDDRSSGGGARGAELMSRSELADLLHRVARSAQQPLSA